MSRPHCGWKGRVMEEVFDVVDEEGRPTGETVLRSEAHAKGIRHRTAHIWVIRRCPKRNGQEEEKVNGTGKAAGAEEGSISKEDRKAGKAGEEEGGKPERVEVLLQKRAMDKDSFPGQYDTSSAGHIHAGDEPRVSAVRELGEELGIKAGPDDLLYAGKFSVSYKEEFHGKPFLDNEVAFVYVYDKPVGLKDLKLQKEEVEDAGWFDLEKTWDAVQRHDPMYCVPPGGLRVLRQWLSRK